MINFVAVVAVALAVTWAVVSTLTGGSLLRRDVEVPTLTGHSVDEAMRELDAHHLVGRLADDVSDTVVPIGTVASQEPAPGSRSRRGTVVHLSVSTGPAFAVVPDVHGIGLDSAELLLTTAGLVPGMVDTEADSVDVGLVVSVMPAPGSRIRRGASVSLTLSEGTASIAVPALEGMTLAEATTRIESAALLVGRVRRTDVGRAGIVQAQRPIAGMRVTRGTAIELIITEDSL